MMVDAIEVTISDSRSIKGLTAEDFDLTNNMVGTFIDPDTGAAPEDYTDSYQTCKVAGTYAYFEIRRGLGAKNALKRTYTDEYLAAYGILVQIAHFSWVPLLDDYSEGGPMCWMLKH